MFGSVTDGIPYSIIDKVIEIFTRKALDLLPEKAIPFHCHNIPFRSAYRFSDGESCAGATLLIRDFSRVSD
jgi:hypothetical protein